MSRSVGDDRIIDVHRDDSVSDDDDCIPDACICEDYISDDSKSKLPRAMGVGRIGDVGGVRISDDCISDGNIGDD